ncbi:MAG: serine hydrolase [Bacteriovoracaceae bacterium]
MDALKKYCIDFLQTQKFDALALGVLRFEDNSFTCFQLEKSPPLIFESGEKIYFDLASLSKPLTNSLAFFSEPERLGPEGELLLNHRGGLPAWGLLPKRGWKEIIKSFPIKESQTLYSDYSALRFMLEFNEKKGPSLHEVAQMTWDKEVLFWKDLQDEHRTIQYGYARGKPNRAKVHDPNAYNIDDYVPHAGLFGTVSGVCRTLLNFEQKFNLVAQMENALSRPHERFVFGWDTVADPNNTLAGNGCGSRTFGHLGFTGTSIWIDPVKKLGHVLLTNATKNFWHDKQRLNAFRKGLGEHIWQKK